MAGFINTTTQKRIAAAIQAATKLNEDRYKFEYRLKNLLSDSNRGRFIAQQESLRSYQFGKRNAATDAGYERKTWTGIQPDTGEICGEVIGNTVGIDETFKNGLFGPLAHMGCVVGSTVVATTDVSRSYKRWFEGKIVTLTIGDKNLQITPNHPVLTDKGWIAVGDLKSGDYIFQCQDWDTFVSNPDNNYMIAAIEKITNSFSMSKGVMSHSMPVATEDFHGDGIINTKVNVISTTGFFPNDIVRNSLENIKHSGFPLRNFSRVFLDRAGNFHSFLLRMNSSFSGFVGGSSHVFYHLRRIFSIFNYVRLTNRANRQSEPFKRISNTGTMDAEALADIHRRIPLSVKLVKIDDLRFSEFRGYVHNLETKDGFYLSESIITHNCRCDLDYS